MHIIEIFEESVDVLKNNKLRTALSILGIIIGIGSVIALMTLGQASQASVKKQIQSLGTNLLTVRPGAQSSGFIRMSSGDSKNLKNEDIDAIKNSNRFTTISQVGAEYSSRSQVSYERNNINVSVSGITPEIFSLRNVQLEFGREFTQEDMGSKNKVAILGPTTAEDLFGTGVNPIGQTIRINGGTYTVIGVTKAKGSSGPFSQDEIVYLPLETAQKVLFGVSHVSTIYISAKSEDVMDAARNQLGYFLLEQHGLKSPEEADFSISSQEDILQTITQVTQTFTALLTGIAAISLLVGGIGIMNIMLVTVTERTTEIGLRKALGAKRKSIIYQFLIEAIILTFIGGLIGVCIGLGASFILTKSMSLPLVFSAPSIILAVVVAATIGIIFGWYPAWKASKLQPIEALRYE
ncbi:FtsX-like permease family protein [candidate division WWE3 bacterium]|uniref:FtsX-like permease family protein n=1 Tax=candidate division WWE3 bacterium TaxID=2053526 RepID=A0A7X9HH52_UNCKA|nr:FtsX-like permease family protein [candidate division WWE3 bacterium]